VRRVSSTPFDPKQNHPGVSPGEGGAGDATNVIWQDQSGFNPYLHGPPYLPGMQVTMQRTANLKVSSIKLSLAEGSELPSVLAFLRALSIIHQSHHWLTFGDSYFGDHLLFERLYNETQDEIDQVAEKAVGTGCDRSLINPGWQSGTANRIISYFCGDGVGTGEVNPLTYVESSLSAEKHFVDYTGQLAKKMQDRNSLPRGTDNLLAGIEDKHQGHIYLLGQRKQGANPGLWKTA
jgi:hypothetical protein